MASHLPPPPPPPPGHEPEPPAPPPPPPPTAAAPTYSAAAEPSGPSPYAVWTVPPVPPGERRVGGWLGFAAGLLATAGIVAAAVVAWPEDDPAPVTTDAPPTTLMTKEAAAALPQVPGVAIPEVPQAATTTTIAVDLFGEGPATAVAAVRAAAGDPGQLIEITVYDTYLFVAYVDPAAPDRIVRRLWRGGNVGEAEANPIDDAVDGSTRPKLFGVGDVDLARLPQMVADAPSHYDEPVEVTHVIIDRFLPFDQRVLVRVYASPPGNPSGGGYVSYTTSGTFVKVCC